MRVLSAIVAVATTLLAGCEKSAPIAPAPAPAPQTYRPGEFVHIAGVVYDFADVKKAVPGMLETRGFVWPSTLASHFVEGSVLQILDDKTILLNGKYIGTVVLTNYPAAATAVDGDAVLAIALPAGRAQYLATDRSTRTVPLYDCGAPTNLPAGVPLKIKRLTADGLIDFTLN